MEEEGEGRSRTDAQLWPRVAWVTGCIMNVRDTQERPQEHMGEPSTSKHVRVRLCGN